VRLRGTLDELVEQAARHDDAWFFCEVEADGVQLDLVREVRDRIPGALRVEQLGHARDAVPEPHHEEPVARSLPDLYAQWLAATGRPAPPELIDAFADAFERAGD
jgi:hypothetical protein